MSLISSACECETDETLRDENENDSQKHNRCDPFSIGPIPAQSVGPEPAYLHQWQILNSSDPLQRLEFEQSKGRLDTDWTRQTKVGGPVGDRRGAMGGSGGRAYAQGLHKFMPKSWTGP
jgi:hypothetical protein